MATLEEITQRFKSAVGADSGLGRSLKFDLKGEGFIHIDGGDVSNEDKPADLVMTLSKADLEELGAGRLDPMSAVMSGRLKLSDMGVAMQLQPKLQALFSQSR
ncbi:MAG TPA: SCP2 sterol-binding domain-containing protein [Caulobacteraceae bacterium]|jgi:putative sterol carrier protein|nr:SCP2 sterol-binding domain-containing protein [Caulobacteraceae bacterium]